MVYCHGKIFQFSARLGAVTCVWRRFFFFAISYSCGMLNIRNVTVNIRPLMNQEISLEMVHLSEPCWSMGLIIGRVFQRYRNQTVRGRTWEAERMWNNTHKSPAGVSRVTFHLFSFPLPIIYKQVLCPLAVFRFFSPPSFSPLSPSFFWSKTFSRGSSNPYSDVSGTHLKSITASCETWTWNILIPLVSAVTPSVLLR